MTAATAAVLAAGVALVGTGTAEAGERTTLQRDADALLKYGTPGVLVGVDTPGRDIKVRSGLGDVSARTPVPWNAKFRIGSFTKTFVAATVLQLVGEGKLSLDDPVERWLPGVVNANGNDGRAITVRQLLQHTSGLNEYLMDMPWLFSEQGFRDKRFTTVTAEEAVALAVQHPPLFPPGAGWEYSNTNYALAGMIIQKVTGRTWFDEVRERIIEPFGLKDTSAPYTESRIPRPHAVGYERFPGEGATEEDPKYGEFVDVTEQNPSWGGAAGAMVSTLDDGNRFLRLLLSGRVLKPAQLEEMRATVTPSEEFRENWPGARYGLGLVFVPNSCGGSWSHGGDVIGFQTRNGVTPDGRRSVMVSFNTHSFEPDEGVTPPRTDKSMELIDHALCSH
ncbi:serine hydrolase [Virgisporangium aliadipatigenens]|uniref:Serine hydrolase n=1 Tax=Virgisporangium aliadipatigenens TaxID=741659 RepID=A0A8J3YRE6_9ACTN|nr:serine hydrolase [Virgisporangium aliadipatigenens]